MRLDQCLCQGWGIPKGHSGQKKPISDKSYSLTRRTCLMSPGFLRSLPIILDSAGKCHLPHHPGTCGSKPMKKSLGSQMKMSRVKPSQYGRMKCKFNWRKKIKMIPSCIQGQPNSGALSLLPPIFSICPK